MQPIWKVYSCYLWKINSIVQQMSSPLLLFNVNAGAIHLLKQEHTKQEAARGQTSKCASSLGKQCLWRGSNNPRMDRSKSWFPYGISCIHKSEKGIILGVCCMLCLILCGVCHISNLEINSSFWQHMQGCTLTHDACARLCFLVPPHELQQILVIKCEANSPKRRNISTRISHDLWWNNNCWTLHCNMMLIWLFLVWTFIALAAKWKEGEMKFDVRAINEMRQTCQTNKSDSVFFIYEKM